MSEIPSQLEEFFREEMKNAVYATSGRYDIDFDSLPRENLCDPVSNEFAVTLEFEFDYEVESPVRAPVDGAKHFVAVVMSHPEFDIETPIVVDGTIKQFDSSYPEIVVETLDSQFVQEEYDLVDV